jgi:hypothetical protein
MDAEDVPKWAAALAAFCARFDDLFARSPSRTQARKCLCGSGAEMERKAT